MLLPRVDWVFSMPAKNIFLLPANFGLLPVLPVLWGKIFFSFFGRYLLVCFSGPVGVSNGLSNFLFFSEIVLSESVWVLFVCGGWLGYVEFLSVFQEYCFGFCFGFDFFFELLWVCVPSVHRYGILGVDCCCGFGGFGVVHGVLVSGG
jgi:hypothetical protein